MKNNLLLVLMLALLPTLANATPPANYKLVWQDEFTEKNLDASKWKPETYKRDAARLSANAATIGNDGLRITTYTQDGVHHTGFLTSKGLFSTTYGYFESMIRFHGASGQHCAFWLQSPQMGKIIGNPAEGGVETDIIEHRLTDGHDKDISNLAAFNLHWDGYGAYHKHAGSQWLAPSSLNNSWHTYAVLWTPAEYIFYVDDVERWRTNIAVSHTPQELRLTCEVKGPHSWSGTIPEGGYGSEQTSPYGMDVRWVRIWQKENSFSH
ncbi:MAG TPA: glycoside hydrolase family 16 protein [Rickettsiales bacterium]|nr:glycoside hydrolase family 16 protein [Rickettsiales bacterium]